MKKAMIVVLVFIIVTLSITGCSAVGDHTEIGEALIYDYYNLYNANNADQACNLFIDELLNMVGGRAGLTEVLNTRYQYYGVVENIDINRIGFEYANDESLIDYEVEAIYSIGGTFTETFTVYVTNDQGIFSAFNLPE
jgi:uncharacterized protein YceK